MVIQGKLRPSTRHWATRKASFFHEQEETVGRLLGKGEVIGRRPELFPFTTESESALAA